MSYMFADCELLKSLNISSFDTKNVRNMDFMFHNCKSLTHLDISSFDMKNVKDLRNMFGRCYFTFLNLYSLCVYDDSLLLGSRIKYVYSSDRLDCYTAIEQYKYDPIYGVYKLV